MAKAARKSEKSRRGGSTFIGILIGLVLGLFIALAVAWYINKLPNPFKEKAGSPKATVPAYPGREPPKVSAPTPAPDKAGAPVKDASVNDATKAADAADKKSTPGGKETFFLQAGSFQNAPDADQMKARLALLGLEAQVQARTIPDKGVWHRVRVGPYTDVDEVNRVRSVLQQNNIESALVKVREGE